MNIQQAAQSILNQIKENIGYYSEEQPTIRKTDIGMEIIWDSGPTDWSSNDNYGLFEELKYYGYPGDYEYEAYWEIPKGFCVEAINSCSILITK